MTKRMNAQESLDYLRRVTSSDPPAQSACDTLALALDTLNDLAELHATETKDHREPDAA